MQVTDSFLYEKEKDGAVILRCFLRDEKVEVPDTLDALPVTALAPYAFSESAPEELPADLMQRCGKPMCGEALKEIVLPSSLQKVGKYCFYNCENLQSLQFFNPSVDWGSGAFAGCHRIRHLRTAKEAIEGGSLQHLLSEITEELTLDLGEAKLVFPEYYEESVENTPARILQVQVHGTGNLYRNCFRNGKFDFAQYDALFGYAKAQESEALLNAMVTDRLRFPCELNPKAKERYLAYAKAHAAGIGRIFLSAEDAPGLSWFLAAFSPSREVLDDLIREASGFKDADLVGILMEYRHQNGSAMSGRKRFIL